MSEKHINVTLKVWRQRNSKDKGGFETYPMSGVSTDMSFLEMFDVLNERLINEGKDPVAFDHGQFKVTTVKDLYAEVAEGFKEWWLVLIYIVSMAAVSFHLYHGFQSAFQTFGLNHSKYNGLIKFIGLWIFSIAIPAGFAAMPLYFFFK